MFYDRIKNYFDQIDALRRPYIKIMVLIVILSLLSIGGLVSLKPESNLKIIIFAIAVISFIANMVFMYLAKRLNSAPLHCLLTAAGGILATISFFLGAFELMSSTVNSLIAFGCILILSTIVIVYTLTKEVNRYDLRRGLKVFTSINYGWDGNFDFYTVTNPKEKRINIFLRRFVVPFAPALGMAISRNLQGELESLAMGFLC